MKDLLFVEVGGIVVFINTDVLEDEVVIVNAEDNVDEEIGNCNVVDSDEVVVVTTGDKQVTSMSIAVKSETKFK